MSQTTPEFDQSAAQAAGVATEVPVFADYWGFDETENWYFPDKQQYLVIKKMNEGARAKYQKNIRNDVTIQRQSGDARLRTDPVAERHALFDACIVDWMVYKNGQPLPFSPRNWQQLRDALNPKLIEDIEKACRKANPWLLQDMSLEDIDREIESLQEMRELKVKEDAGE